MAVTTQSIRNNWKSKGKLKMPSLKRNLQNNPPTSITSFYIKCTQKYLGSTTRYLMAPFFSYTLRKTLVKLTSSI